MSNLLKYSFVNNNQQEVVINSNERAEELLKGTLKTQAAEEETDDGESDGLFAGLSVPEGFQDVADRVMELTQKEAESIMDQANQKADSIIEEANRRAQAIYDEQAEAGYHQGMEKAEKARAELLQKLEEEYLQKKQKLEGALKKREESLEKDLIDVIIQVFDKVFHIQFEEKREILLSLVDNTLHNVEKSKVFRFRVSEDTRKYLEEHVELLREQVGQEAELSFVTDTAMQDTECSIETDWGVFDCSIELELSSLIRDIKSLCI